MPEAMREQSALTGIEIDPLTAGIARLLYPDANIRQQRFEQSKLPNDGFDLVISNVPFGNYKVFDPEFNRHNFLIHDYSFAKALEKARPGGLVAFITSMGTMDKEDARLRDYLHERAELLGAIRLPNTAFKQNANTEVTTDMVFCGGCTKASLRAGTIGVNWPHTRTPMGSLSASITTLPSIPP